MSLQSYMHPHSRYIRSLRSSVMGSSIPRFLLPYLYTSKRNASILSNLCDNPGALRRKRRVGRGPSSSKGKTSGRGHKGQKQHGKVPAGFQGGQTPIEVTHGLPKGFKNKYALLSLPSLRYHHQISLLPPAPKQQKKIQTARLTTHLLPFEQTASP